MTTHKLQVLDPAVSYTFSNPVKKINEGQDVSHFLVSKAYSDIITFLLQLNRSMFPLASEGNTQRPPSSDAISNLKSLLENLDRSIDEVPPDPGPRRFGNVSFRKWHQLLHERAPTYIQEHLSPSPLSHPQASDPTARGELTSYLLGSFGSAQRLDYGTGHELSFLAFLGCIWKLGGFPSSPADEQVERSIILDVIDPYLHLIRRLIKTYTLEPAGSHGVWGLDDHSFLPYIFGSAQFSPPIPPLGVLPLEGSLPSAPEASSIINPQTVARERSHNLYFGAIGFINDVKKGPFWEHSPMLFDISGVKAGWAKINKGMLKMYDAEVLSKFPVVQHFHFGSLFSWERDPDAKEPVVPGVHANVLNRMGHQSRDPMLQSRDPMLQSSTRAPVGSTAMGGASPSMGSAQEMVGTAAPWAKGVPSTTIPLGVTNDVGGTSRRPPAFLKGGLPPPPLPPNGSVPKEQTMQASTKGSLGKI